MIYVETVKGGCSNVSSCVIGRDSRKKFQCLVVCVLGRDSKKEAVPVSRHKYVL